jgi:hypothetical protein
MAMSKVRWQAQDCSESMKKEPRKIDIKAKQQMVIGWWLLISGC